MNIQQLRYFLVLADTLSFTKTAEKYYISQTAVSNQIKALEEVAALYDGSSPFGAFCPCFHPGTATPAIGDEKCHGNILQMGFRFCEKGLKTSFLQHFIPHGGAAEEDSVINNSEKFIPSSSLLQNSRVHLV